MSTRPWIRTPTHDTDEALIDIYHRIRPGDPATRDSATSLMNSYFFDTRRYDLAKVGRYKLNKKLGLSLPETVRSVTREDIIKIIHYIIGLSEAGSLVAHLNSANLHKRMDELDKAVAAEVKSASPEDIALHGRVYMFQRNLEMLRNIKFGDLLTED